MDKTLISLVIAIIGSIIAIYNLVKGNTRESVDEKVKLGERLKAIEKDIEYNKDAILRLSTLMLHKPEVQYKRRDELVKKLNKEGLDLEEVNEFVILLKSLRSRDDVDERDKLLAEFTLEQLKRKYRFLVIQ